MAAKLTAVTSRAQDVQFGAQCSWAALRDRLPLRWPAPAATPRCPKRRFRSQYVYTDWHDLADPQVRQHLSEFDLLLCLVDFAPLRPVLAQLLGWTRGATLAHLAAPRYRDYAQAFGFRDGIYPTEGGLRHFLTALGRSRPHLDLCIPRPTVGDTAA